MSPDRRQNRSLGARRNAGDWHERDNEAGRAAFDAAADARVGSSIE